MHCTRRVLCPQNLCIHQGSEDLAKKLLHNCFRGLTRSRCSIALDSYRVELTAVCSDPKAAQGFSMADCGKQMGGSPKASQQHLAGETSLLEVTRSPTAVARVLCGPSTLSEILRPRNCGFVSSFTARSFHKRESDSVHIAHGSLSFAVAQGRQKDNEAHTFCGDDDGFASKPHP